VIPKGPKPPKHLEATSRKWWAAVVASYVLEEHHVRLLTLAAEAWDRAQQARGIVTREGLTFIDKHGQPRAHPACAIERDSRIAFARLLRELDLDVEPPRATRRSPGRY
jgi:P27 family predicted phage terminase small subunit